MYMGNREFSLMVYKHVAVGGTFDHFHRGHKALLAKAFSAGERLTIGISSDRFAGNDKEPFEDRKSRVLGFISSLGMRNYRIIKLEKSRVLGFISSLGMRNYRIITLEDPFGPARKDGSMDAIVVSEETIERALELNSTRLSEGLDELHRLKIPMMLAEDGGALSSSRIRLGEIDLDGRVR
jgi:pantetheine-phosphate adenylyltransferase